MTYRIIQGDCIEGMRTLPDESVHCVVTSPPYYGLRDYGTASWEGGDPACDHKGKPLLTRANINNNTGNRDVKNALYFEPFKDICGKCGAHRIDQQIGLEESPDAYVAKMVDVFREVRRILRNDGTVWLNLGDSYAGSNVKSGKIHNTASTLQGTLKTQEASAIVKGIFKYDVKPKDLVGIPWRVAFALQSDGWYLRQDIIWHKPNPMPESVTDRCTKSHEYIFLLSKSERYYYDNDAVKEKVENLGAPRKFRDAKENSDGTLRNDNGRIYTPLEYRNKRSVWTVSTKPYAEAHFAVYPTKLIEPCILAGCPVDGVVFDPFTGSGTTALVALTNGRSYIGTELNPEYVALANKRLSAIQPKMDLV